MLHASVRGRYAQVAVFSGEVTTLHARAPLHAKIWTSHARALVPYCCLGGGRALFGCLGGQDKGRVFAFSVRAFSVLFGRSGRAGTFFLFGQGTGVHSLTGLPGLACVVGPNEKNIIQQKLGTPNREPQESSRDIVAIFLPRSLYYILSYSYHILGVPCLRLQYPCQRTSGKTLINLACEAFKRAAHLADDTLAITWDISSSAAMLAAT